MKLTSREKEMLRRVSDGLAIPYNRSVSAVMGSLRRKGLISGRPDARAGNYSVTETGRAFL